MNTNVLRKIARESEVAAMREGRILRAVTFTNKKRAASRNACKKNNRKDW